MIQEMEEGGGGPPPPTVFEDLDESLQKRRYSAGGGGVRKHGVFHGANQTTIVPYENNNSGDKIIEVRRRSSSSSCSSVDLEQEEEERAPRRRGESSDINVTVMVVHSVGQGSDDMKGGGNGKRLYRKRSTEVAYENEAYERDAEEVRRPGKRQESEGKRHEEKKVSICNRISEEDESDLDDIAVNEEPRSRKVSRSGSRKISHGSRAPAPIERKISMAERKMSEQRSEGGGPGTSRKSSGRQTPGGSAGDKSRKMSVFERAMHQFTMVQLEIASIREGSTIFERFVPKKSPQMLAALAATIGAFGMGTVMAWTSPAFPSLERDPNWNLTKDEMAWVASCVPLAATFAGPPTGVGIGVIGRRFTMISLSVPFVLGWMLIAFAQNVAMMMIGRCLTGLCAGAFSLTAPVFISETAEDSIRGALGSGFQLMVVLGFLFSYVLGAFVDWKMLAIISASVPVIMCVLMIYVPASPRFLLSRGKRSDAIKALMWFRGAEKAEQVQEELDLIQKSIDDSRQKEVRLASFFSGEIFKPLGICLGLMFFQSFSGTDAVTFYTVDIFRDAGSKLDDNVAAIIVGSVQVLATFCSMLIVDKAGRRVLLLLSDLFMAVSLFALGGYFFMDGETRTAYSLLPLISLIVFVTAYSIGFGPVPWMMMGEVLPNHVIGPASAIAVSFTWICTFVITRFFDDVKKAVNSNYCYMGFGVFCIIGIFYTFFFVPETKGKSLDEIQEMFVSKKKAKRMPTRTSQRRVSRTTVDSYFFA